MKILPSVVWGVGPWLGNAPFNIEPPPGILMFNFSSPLEAVPLVEKALRASIDSIKVLC